MGFTDFKDKVVHKVEDKVTRGLDKGLQKLDKIHPGLGEHVGDHIAELGHKIHQVHDFKEEVKRDFKNHLHLGRQDYGEGEYKVVPRYRFLFGGKTMSRKVATLAPPLILLQHWAVEISFDDGNYLFELTLNKNLKDDDKYLHSNFTILKPEDWSEREYKEIPFGSFWSASTRLTRDEIIEKGKEIIEKREEYRLLVSDCHCFAIDFIYSISPILSQATGVYLAKIAESFIVRPIARIPSGLVTKSVRFPLARQMSASVTEKVSPQQMAPSVMGKAILRSQSMKTIALHTPPDENTIWSLEEKHFDGHGISPEHDDQDQAYVGEVKIHVNIVVHEVPCDS